MILKSALSWLAVFGGLYGLANRGRDLVPVDAVSAGSDYQDCPTSAPLRQIVFN